MVEAQKAFTRRSLPGTPLLQPGQPFLASASIEDPTVNGLILGHLASRELPAGSSPSRPGSSSLRRGSTAARRRHTVRAEGELIGGEIDGAWQHAADVVHRRRKRR